MQSEKVKEDLNAKLTDRQRKMYKKVTLGDLGPTFPIPPNLSGTISEKKNFGFREWTMETEEVISERKSKAKNMGEFVNGLFRHMITDFCGQDFQAMPDERRMLLINQMEFPNVMYAYIYLRVEELGPELRMDITCPTCGKLNKDYVADLQTLEIMVKDSDTKDKPGHQRNGVYDLSKPIVLDDGKIITKIRYGVSKWEAMESAQQEDLENTGRMKRMLLKSSILGFETEAGPIETFVEADPTIKKLKKVDFEKLLREVTENNGGPHMAIGGVCIHCKKEWAKTLDWSWDYFFDSSSL